MQLPVIDFPESRIYSALAQSVEHAAVNRSVVGSSPTSGAIPVAIARRIHLFPFRTQKLSSVTPDVVGYNAPQDKVAAGFHLKPARFHIENGRVTLFIMSFVRRTAAIAWIANRL